jgi:hypothetical protein
VSHGVLAISARVKENSPKKSYPTGGKEMSLAIDVDTVIEVLLADGWHKCAFSEEGVSSFELGRLPIKRGVSCAAGNVTLLERWFEMEGKNRSAMRKKMPLKSVTFVV